MGLECKGLREETRLFTEGKAIVPKDSQLPVTSCFQGFEARLLRNSCAKLELLHNYCATITSFSLPVLL